MDYFVKDISLAKEGQKNVEVTLLDMPGIVELKKLYDGGGRSLLMGLKLQGVLL